MASHRSRLLTVVPVNGWGNRLRALASCGLLARHLGARLRVAWRDEPNVFVAKWSTIFSPETPIEVIGYESLRAELGITDRLPPKYLTSSPNGAITLRGHEKGEQEFIPALLDAARNASLTSFVVVAGDHFTVEADSVAEDADLSAMKLDIYRSLKFSAEIEEMFSNLLRPGYRALHLRYGDRSSWAPSDNRIRTCLDSTVEPGDRWIVVGDDRRRVRRWVRRLRRMRCEAISLHSGERHRASEKDALIAVAEWRALSLARDIVHFPHSSFATEAAVLVSGSGGRSIAV